MKVLFLGNSHTYFNDMPRTFARLCAAAGAGEPQTVLLAHSARPLSWHLEEYFELRYNLLYGGYDYCVIQQQAHPFPGAQQTARDGGWVIELCRAAGTVPVLLMTWAERAAPQRQQAMTLAYRELAAQTGALLAPVGEIWQLLRQRSPEIELFWRDGEHASPLGDYLIAATLCALLTGADPQALPSLGADFSGEEEIAFFDHPQVREDPAQIETALEEASCAAIRQAIREVCAGADL